MWRNARAAYLSGMPKPPRKKLPTWRVWRLRNKQEFLGTVDAETEEKAIDLAMERWEIREDFRDRVLVRKE